ncbi:hypothetical protein Tsubulata_032930 [Turnera subulata]|uniref:Ribosomal RNA-processing protein 17 n=1 Tax=Turnera subulata TaxID=218843 RepID=A0A9Q0JA98_9ROSI|nr:hypothetical protein Tsubulata_032930 [Turnera subulata]
MEPEMEEVAAIQIKPTRAGHIKKRALKNKSLSVSFDEKDLRDYVTGFHKRKKKRRKEAHKHQEEAARRKRIEQRKKRKLEKEFALYGGAPPSTDKASDEGDLQNEDEEDGEPLASVNGTTMYDNGEMQVTVTTSEISRDEDEDEPSEKIPAAVPRFTGAHKSQTLSVSKKKSFKKVQRHSSHSKQKKRDKNKGKKKNKKR